MLCSIPVDANDYLESFCKEGTFTVYGGVMVLFVKGSFGKVPPVSIGSRYRELC